MTAGILFGGERIDRGFPVLSERVAAGLLFDPYRPFTARLTITASQRLGIRTHFPTHIAFPPDIPSGG